MIHFPTMRLLLLFLLLSQCSSFDITTSVNYTITIVFRASLMKWYELVIPVEQVGTFHTHLALGLCSVSTASTGSFALEIHGVESPRKNVVWHLLNNVKPIVFFNPEHINTSLVCCRIDWVLAELVKEEQFKLASTFPPGLCPWHSINRLQTLDWYTTNTSVKYYITSDTKNVGFYKCRFLSIWPK